MVNLILKRIKCIGNLSTELQTYDENPRLLVPFDMHVEDETLLLEIGENIKEFYSPNSDLADNLLAGVQVNCGRNLIIES